MLKSRTGDKVSGMNYQRNSFSDSRKMSTQNKNSNFEKLILDFILVIYKTLSFM
jgi:hypothetical protein